MDILKKYLKQNLCFGYQRTNKFMERIIHVTDAFFSHTLCSTIIFLSIDEISTLGLLYSRRLV